MTMRCDVLVASAAVHNGVRDGRGARRTRRLPAWLLGALLAAAAGQPAFAEHSTWAAQSASYDVYLGIVPAAVAERDRELSRMHQRSPHYLANLGAGSRHVTVAVFNRATMERVENAHVTAEVVENDLVRVERAAKTLEARRVSDRVTYCNFFKMHWNGTYRINVRIREPGADSERVTFVQEEVDYRL